jgi:hypothetical protein
LIAPTAAAAETILPEIATPPSPAKENSPLLTESAGENVKVSAGEPHVTLASLLP